MSFHLGKPILVMIVLAALSGAGILYVSWTAPPRADLTVWVFASSHADTYRPILRRANQAGQEVAPQVAALPTWDELSRATVDLCLITGRALNIRLVSLFMSGRPTKDLPDLVEMEISQIGKFFRPPVNEVGFLPLNDYLEKSGWRSRIIASRFAPWSKHGVIFGVPHDVHPCTITYREDLFREAGVDLASAATWPEFHARCLAYQKYWDARGGPKRWAFELPEARVDLLVPLLLQRGINLVNEDNRVDLANPKVAQTVAFYASMVAGPTRVATESSGGTAVYEDLASGRLGAVLTPDWRVFYFKQFGAAAAGKVRMMPLPRFEPSDPPTTTWGGTMIGIPRACPNPDLAWKLLEFLYLSPTGVEARFQFAGIVPPVKDMWEGPAYHKPDPFYGGQKTMELFVELAPQIPGRIMTPATGVAYTALGTVLSQAVLYLRDGGSLEGLEAFCQQRLNEQAEDLRKRIAQWQFDEN